MQKIVRISTVLSWINLIIGSVIVLAGLLMLGASPNALGVLMAVVLTSSIVLHSYATMQLLKCIKQPDRPLGRHTPAGIRFMGYAAIFFAVINSTNAVMLLQNSKAFIDQIKMPEQAKMINMNSLVHGVGIFILLMGISILFNVILSFRLLRWYLQNTEGYGS